MTPRRGSIINRLRRWLRPIPLRKPTTHGAEQLAHSAWRDIVDSAPPKARGAATTEDEPDDPGRTEHPSADAARAAAPDSEVRRKQGRSTPKARAPHVRSARHLLAAIEREYPTGVPLVLPERPWGGATGRFWRWLIVLLVIVGLFVLSVIDGADPVPASGVLLVVAIPVVRDLAVSYLERGLRPNDVARFGPWVPDAPPVSRPQDGSSAAQEPPS